MLSIFGVLAGTLAIFVIGKIFEKNDFLSAEARRKFVHIGVGAFAAVWPWIISWRAIQLIGLILFVSALINRRINIFDFRSKLSRNSYGDFFVPMAITICASATNIKIFYAVAILHISLADGLAAIVGTLLGKEWRYKIFGYTKSIVGSMTFWLVSMLIFGVLGLFAHDYISFDSYFWLIILAPPALTAIENLGIYGIDNLLVPIAALVALQIASRI